MNEIRAIRKEIRYKDIVYNIQNNKAFQIERWQLLLLQVHLLPRVESKSIMFLASF